MNTSHANLTDAEIEHEIDNAFIRLSIATNEDDRRQAWQECKYWKALRSPEKVEEIERAKGIYTEPKP
jgi:hypothetical protein